MYHGFVKVAVAAPQLTLAAPEANARTLGALTTEASARGVQILVLPVGALTGATLGDLAHNALLQQGSLHALGHFLSATKEIHTLVVLPLSLPVGSRLCSLAALCQNGQVLGLAADTKDAPLPSHLSLLGEQVPLGDLRLLCRELPALRIAVCFGNALPASDATLICNPSATPELVSRADARRRHVVAFSEQYAQAWALAEANDGESTTDAVYGGHGILCEDGCVLAERRPLSSDAPLTITEFDLSYLLREQTLRSTVSATDAQEIRFSLPPCRVALTRPVSTNPFVPAQKAALDARCEDILTIQAAGLARRMERAHAKKLVVGISGGLDSTLALLVMARATDLLGRDRRDILAVTMPCFGTTERTKNNATLLCRELGVDFRSIDIFSAVEQHFADIGHDPSVRDVTYENAQARERTQVLMDLANACGGMVVGTGDLSELALGWATYNGDHMSMYGVNASVPKTLIRHIVAYAADRAEEAGSASLATALRDVLATPVSPELLPADASGRIAQRTEDLVGPYELHDFFLYHMVRKGAPPEKILRLAGYALGDTYDDATVLHWLEIFTRRFFSQQFKRSCLPDGRAVGSLSFSPRAGWHMPSDASAELWMAEIERLKQGLRS